MLLSGGSSVGVKDAACRIIESVGQLLLHGIAIKPGKPTILGKPGKSPLWVCPGIRCCLLYHKTFCAAPAGRLMDRDLTAYTVTARVTREHSVSNHGRASITAAG